MSAWLLTLSPQTYLLLLIGAALLFFAVAILLGYLVHRGVLKAATVAEIARAVDAHMPALLAEAARTGTPLDDLLLGWVVLPVLKHLEALDLPVNAAVGVQVQKFAEHKAYPLRVSEAAGSLPLPSSKPPAVAPQVEQAIAPDFCLPEGGTLGPNNNLP